MSPRLLVTNNAETTLVTNITSTDVSLTLTSSVTFPDAPFRLTINSEIIEVGVLTRVTHTCSSLLRGREGTVATAHTAGSRITVRWTAGLYQELADRFHASTGHRHTGAAQDAPQITATGLAALAVVAGRIADGAVDTLARIAAGIRAVAATPNTLVERDAAGRSKMAAPAAADDVARLDTVTGQVSTHAALTAAGTHGSAVAATANTVVHRDAAGRSKVAAPAVADDIARLDTVTTHAALTAVGTHGSAVTATANTDCHRDGFGRTQVADGVAAADVVNRGQLDTRLPLTGGTMTGPLLPQNNVAYTTGQARRIIMATTDPVGGGNGDVWIRY